MDFIIFFKEKVFDSMGLSEFVDEVLNVGSEWECIWLIWNVVGDIFEGYLKKGYCFFLVRDFGILVFINC